MKPTRGIVFVLLFCLAAGPGRGAGLRDVQDSWLRDSLETAQLLRGEGSAKSAGWCLEAMQGLLFGLPELPQQGARWCWRGGGERAPEMGLSWQQTGTDLFRTTGMEGWLGWGRERGFGLAYRTRQADSEAGQWPRWSRFSVRWHGTLRLAGGRARWRVLLPATEVAAGAIPEMREPFLRVAWLRPSWACVWQVDRDPTGRPCSGWALEMGLGQGLGVGLRADGPSGAMGLSLLFLRGVLLLRTSHLAHPRLGLMHRFSVGVVRP